MKLKLIIALMAGTISFGAVAQETSLYSYLCQQHKNVESYDVNTAAHGKTLVMYPGDRAQSGVVDSVANIAWIKNHIHPAQLPADCVSYFLSQGYWDTTANIARFHFDFDSAAMSQTDQQVLSRLVLALQAVPDVSVVGHTDNTGSIAYNARLGSQRAQTVSQRIKANTNNVALVTSSQGESQPIATNATRYGRKLNRRVEIILKDHAPD